MCWVHRWPKLTRSEQQHQGLRQSREADVQYRGLSKSPQSKAWFKHGKSVLRQKHKDSDKGKKSRNKEKRSKT